ncbi:uncharacterized protein LOC119681527 isoform X2 [Teleopsis dalmanni]|uniref:uncharacterized protein LOC119681527 isoform X2 n=1 Tax=Teleopsis dalmanni TaxID=139649 RepID=UPI0018CFD61E|nr:uncharacterized protein LOC119681527 isoform X2 [Teleopsis dalmanni]
MELSPERSGMMDESLTYEQAELLSFIKLLQACPCLWHRFARQKFNKQSKINAYLLLLKKRKEHNTLATFQSVREQVLELVKFILLKKTNESVNDNITKTDIKQVIKNIGEEGKSTCEDDIVEKVLNCNKLLAELSFITNNYRKNLKNVVLECQFCYCSCSNYPELWAHMTEKHLHHQNKKRKKTNQNHTSQWQKKRKTYSRLSQKRRNTNVTKYKAPRVASRILKKSKEVGQQSSLIRIPYNLRSRAHCTNVQNNIFPNRLTAVISEGFLSVSDENEAAILVGKEMFLQNGEEASTSSACSELNQIILNNLSSSNIYENACIQKSKRRKKSRVPLRNRKQRLMHAKSTKTRQTKKINRDLKMQSNTKLLDDASQLNLSSSSIGLFQAVEYNTTDLSTEDSNLNNLLTQVPLKDDVPSSKSSLNLSVSPEGSAEFQLRKTEMNSHSSTLLAKKVLREAQCKKSTCQYSFKSNVAKRDVKCFETEGILYYIPECSTSFCKCLSETKSITIPISNEVKSSDVHVEQESICKQDAISLLPNLIEDETVNETQNSVAVVNSEVKVLMNAKDLRNSEPDIRFKTTTNGPVVQNMDWRQPKSFYNTEDSLSYVSDSNSDVKSKRETPLILKTTVTKTFNTKKGTKTTGKSKYWDDDLNEFSESFLKSFIQLYRKCECLWKQDHELYNNHQEKVTAYNKLLEMYKDEARDPEASLDAVKRLIRRLRFCHRQLSKGKKLGVLKRARIYKKLEFLKNGSTICFPNICSKCSLTFSNVQTLKQHARDVHNEKKPFKCCSCELRFRYKVEMSRHYKNRHKQK